NDGKGEGTERSEAAMNVYERVQHTMIPLTEIEPAQKRWIGQIADLVDVYVHATPIEDATFVAMVSFVLQLAGERIWRSSKGQPCWSRFDVDAHFRIIDQGRQQPEMKAMMVLILLDFYRWMVDTKR